ncbi:MAG: methyltransferase domain-containing protein, partial [Candidatus Aenigmarchaeota archaeon]|nr:methyltransferase domain-containing protein [Candidatus Aenigmarchaeota archaeon]
DIACGNCRNLLPPTKKGLSCVGIDFSKGMIKEGKKYAKKRGMKINLIIGDLTNLPLKENIASTIIYTSSITHLRTKKERLKSLKEVKRIGKTDLRMILSIWNRWQPKFLWKLLKAFLFGRYPNVYVDWNYHGATHKRFYHLYSKNEMLKDLKKVGLKSEKIIKDDHGGIWFWVRR